MNSEDERNRRARKLIRKAITAGVGASFRFDKQRATVLAIDDEFVTLLMPSGKQRTFSREIDGVRV